MTTKDILAECTQPQRAALLRQLLRELPAETVAETVAAIVPERAIPELLLPHLMDTAGVAEALARRATELGHPRKYDRSAVLHRVERGTLSPTGVTINDGHTFWKWEVQRILADLNPTIGRPSANT